MKALRGRKHEKVYAKALQSPGGGGLVPCGSYIDVLHERQPGRMDIFLVVEDAVIVNDRIHDLLAQS